MARNQLRKRKKPQQLLLLIMMMMMEGDIKNSLPRSNSGMEMVTLVQWSVNTLKWTKYPKIILSEDKELAEFPVR